MTTQLKKNSIKKLVSLAGVASASALLSFPAFALTNSDVSSSSQLSNNHNYRSDSTNQLLAQTPSNPQENQPSSTGENNQTTGENNRTTGENNRTNERSTRENSRSNQDLSRPADSNGSGMRALTGGDSVKGINWFCLNNPNPDCGR